MRSYLYYGYDLGLVLHDGELTSRAPAWWGSDTGTWRYELARRTTSTDAPNPTSITDYSEAAREIRAQGRAAAAASPVDMDYYGPDNSDHSVVVRVVASVQNLHGYSGPVTPMTRKPEWDSALRDFLTLLDIPIPPGPPQFAHGYADD
ncbi:hypothetical protein ACWIGI_41570 [Nocardia sp. NPDC055321]